jgi:hypothetical protein
MEDDPHVLAIARVFVEDMGPKEAAALARRRAEYQRRLNKDSADFWRRVADAIEANYHD